MLLSTHQSILQHHSTLLSLTTNLISTTPLRYHPHNTTVDGDSVATNYPFHTHPFVTYFTPVVLLYRSFVFSSFLNSHAMSGTVSISDVDPYSHFLNSTNITAKPTPCPSLPLPNHAAVLLKKHSLVVQSLALPTQIPPNFALLAIKAVGICGSDVHYLQHGGIGPFQLTAPMVIGHECSGQVLAVGAGVNALAAGDRVALEPGISCHHCKQCQTGRYNLCPDMKFFATPPVHGSLCRYVLHPGRSVLQAERQAHLRSGRIL